MKTYRIVRRKSVTGTETFKVQEKRWFWWSDVQQPSTHEGLVNSMETIWHPNIYAARRWVSAQASGADIVIEVLKVA